MLYESNRSDLQRILAHSDFMYEYLHSLCTHICVTPAKFTALSRSRLSSNAGHVKFRQYHQSPVTQLSPLTLPHSIDHSTPHDNNRDEQLSNKKYLHI